MELVLKLPKDKPPFIGVLFEDEREAAELNKSWVNSYRTLLYNVRLETVGKSVNLFVRSEIMSFNHLYVNLKYDQDKLFKFMYMTRKTNAFKFAHIVSMDKEFVVVRTKANQTLFVLNVSRFDVVFEV